MAGIMDPEAKDNLNFLMNLNATNKTLLLSSVMIIVFINLLILHFRQDTDNRDCREKLLGINEE